jgi:hypothetical protein
MPLATPAVGAAPAAQLFDCVREFERPGSLATLWKLCGA